jgi:cobaltochelatase CobS
LSLASETIIHNIELESNAIYYDFTVPEYHNYWAGGIFHHNCGKTDALKSIFSVLNIPTVIVSAKSSTEPDDILGRTQLRDGNTVFVPGELLTAYGLGYAIIFDEIDGYNPEVVMALHRMLEREVIVLDDGTVIRPAARNLIAATANTRGDGHGGDVYAATKTFNLATLNRFEKLIMNYPAEEVEISILKNAFGDKLDDTIILAMVKTANDVRRAYNDGNCPGPMSIRDLLRFGRKLIQSWNRKDIAPVYHAFDKSFANGVDPYVREMLHTLCQSRFGIPSPATSAVI